jgi:hypothetical protein
LADLQKLTDNSLPTSARKPGAAKSAEELEQRSRKTKATSTSKPASIRSAAAIDR